MEWEDVKLDDRRQYIAGILGCDPNEPKGWPIALIDRLIAVRDNRGKKAFFTEVGYLLSLC